MPDIIVNISPPKCGTTSLYFALVASSHIARSTLKEPRFFAAAQDAKTAGLPDAMQTTGNFANGRDWHDALFRDEPAARFRIDFTTYYAITENTPELLARYYPDPHLIMVLRDPVKRFVSQYYQYIKMGIPVPSIEEVVRGDSAVSRLMYRFADYRATYRRYAEAFGENAILLLDFEDLKSAPAKVSAKCNQFLGLADIGYAPSEREKNVAGRPRFGFIQRAMFSDTTRRALRGITPGLKLGLLKLRKKVVLANVKAASYPQLSLDLEEELAQRLAPQTEFYRSLGETREAVLLTRV